MRFRTLLVGSAVMALASVAIPAEEPKPIQPEQFTKLHKMIKPQRGESRFQDIPWLLSVWEGRQKAAGHFLLDNLFREWAGHPLLLDFEGSELPGVSFFYSNFGGHDQPYYFYRYNDLPWPLRLFKK